MNKLQAHGTPHEPDSGYVRLETQIRWYDTKSGIAQRNFKCAKVLEICFTALIPIIAGVSGIATAILGVALTILKGLQELNKWSQNWLAYRTTCEELRLEKYSYLTLSGSYEGMDDGAAMKLLTQRVENLISTEHKKWITSQQYLRKSTTQQADKGKAA